jgi:DNA-binding beta-propeller fold protein YncE
MPEGFSLDPNSDRVYVNLQANGTVAVLKRDKATGALTLEATWAINGAKGNYAGAFDPATGHYFAVCRNPAKLVVLDTKTGTQVAALECIDDTDGAWWDPVLRRVFVSGGGSGGRVDVFQQGAASEAGKPADYKLFHKETTNVGARTSVLVPEQRRFIVAAPKIGADPTFLYVYLIGP